MSRATGTPGDDLVGWGLAIVLADACGVDVTLEDRGDALEVEARMPRAVIERRIDQGPPLSWRLHWLASTEKGRAAPAGVRSLDRDALREAWRAVRALPGIVWQPLGDAPAMTTEVPAWRYPRFEPLTNPGTQWSGYNGLVEATEKLATPAGLRALLALYDPAVALAPRERDLLLADLGLKAANLRWRNPPGFVYPTLNKGPTMRLRVGGSDGKVGESSQPDWLMADRGDRSLAELCLAYVGYFNVAQVLGDDEGRTVVVPLAARVRVPRILSALDRVRLPNSGLSDYQIGTAALAYGEAALEYLEELRGEDPSGVDLDEPVLHGAAVTRYWQPSGNTYAPLRCGMAPLPRWLPTIRRDGFDAARGVLRLHRRKLRQVRGTPREERKLPGEQRDAVAWYARSLDGDVVAWCRAVVAWMATVRTAKIPVSPWTIHEVERIVMADAPELLDIIGGPGDDSAFRRIARAIRHSTVYAHFARQKRQNVFEPQYDLIAAMMAAAERHPQDFLRELCAFAARYNDETMRRNEVAAQRHQNRPMLREDDLARVVEWTADPRLGRIVPMALLAFGSSTLGRRDAEDVGEEQVTGEAAAADVAGARDD